MSKKLKIENMAHTCPDCGSYCTCSGDWDDIDLGEWIGCMCDCADSNDNDFDDDDLEERNDPNDSRNL